MRGLAAPVNELLTSLVHNREGGSRQLTPADVRAAVITATVNSWFTREHRQLAWRLPTTTAWGVLVSETMLQQTQAARVEPKWLDFMERWPTPAAMAEATEAEVLRFWDRLGYPRRALWLLACARAIAEEHDGRVPETREALLALPGVGPYTASAVMSFAHGVPEPVVDTNVRRVLSRAFLGEETPWGPSAVRDAAEMRAVAPADPTAANLWNAASMELGAVICTAKRPNCNDCPIVGLCAWVSAGRPASTTIKKPQAKFAGSDREMRGMVLRELRAIPGGVEIEFLRRHLDPDGADSLRFDRALTSLKVDGLIFERNQAEIALTGD
ncbi:adenine glycosylase [Pseudoclavibacter sp. AY1F1]|nr:adenine glycosylase [Pseudoclavibacter sp. AY1F1]